MLPPCLLVCPTSRTWKTSRCLVLVLVSGWKMALVELWHCVGLNTAYMWVTVDDKYFHRHVRIWKSVHSITAWYLSTLYLLYVSQKHNLFYNPVTKLLALIFTEPSQVCIHGEFQGVVFTLSLRTSNLIPFPNRCNAIRFRWQVICLKMTTRRNKKFTVNQKRVWAKLSLQAHCTHNKIDKYIA